MFITGHKLEYLWTWGGAFFGYRQDANLWSYMGRHVGYMTGHTVFGLDGHYLGEIVNGRLLVNDTRKTLWSAPLAQLPKYPAFAKLTDLEGHGVYSGFEDFPAPEAFEAEKLRHAA